jgi:hypothetical protein
MTAAEFTAAGVLLFGRRFKSLLARAVNLERTSIQAYAFGKRRIPPRVAAQIRAIVNIGPVGMAIRASIKKCAPELLEFKAHRMAKQIVFDLTALGLLAENSPGDHRGPQFKPTGRKRD